MNKLFLTMTLALSTLVVSAQFSVLTTVTSVEEGDKTTYNVTDKLGVGYNLNDCILLGATMDGEDSYDLLVRYTIHKSGIWATCVYNYDEDSEELINKMDLGLGYSFNVWKDLYVDPSYIMPLEEDINGERQGNFNVGLRYKF
jgi:predicted porin